MGSIEWNKQNNNKWGCNDFFCLISFQYCLLVVFILPTFVFLVVMFVFLLSFSLFGIVLHLGGHLTSLNCPQQKSPAPQTGSPLCGCGCFELLASLWKHIVWLFIVCLLLHCYDCFVLFGFWHILLMRTPGPLGPLGLCLVGQFSNTSILEMKRKLYNCILQLLYVCRFFSVLRLI